MEEDRRGTEERHGRPPPAERSRMRRRSGAERRRMDQLLPAGFRFFPTDEELITCYLARKAMDGSFTSPAIRDVDLYKSEPWDYLPCT